MSPSGCGSVWFVEAGRVHVIERPISRRYFNQDDRIEIAEGLAAGESVMAIAARIGKSYQSVYREIARNRKEDGAYQPWNAHNQAYLRRRRPRTRRFAEVGLDMDAFPTAGHLASWAGICPGNNSSGGKRRAGPTRHGSMWLRIGLTEAAQAAARTKGTYLAAHHAQVRGRRGTHKAIGATRHDILIAYYHIVRDRVAYQDLGPDWNGRRRCTEQQTRRLVRQLERLGVTVTINTRATTNALSRRAQQPRLTGHHPAPAGASRSPYEPKTPAQTAVQTVCMQLVPPAGHAEHGKRGRGRVLVVQVTGDGPPR